MASQTTIAEHLSEFNKLLSQLLNVGVKVDEEDKALIMLNSLPDSYEHLVTTLTYAKESIKLDEVTAALLNHEMRKRPDVEVLTSKTEGLAVRGRDWERHDETSRSRSKSRGKKNVTCHFCKKKGHIKRDCYKFKAQEEKKSVETASVAQGSEDNSAFSADASTSRDESRTWIMDSGCSYHMCPSRDMFSTYQKVDGGSVLMGNDHSCRIVGIGTIRIRMFDGVIRTLQQVRHIPELRKSLLSLGQIANHGCKSTLDIDGLKVSKGQLVVMKGRKVGNLFYLEGSSILGGAAVASTSGSDGGESDSTRLWHLRMGYAGEKTLLELHRRKLLDGKFLGKMGFCKNCVLGKAHRVTFATGSRSSPSNSQ